MKIKIKKIIFLFLLASVFFISSCGLESKKIVLSSNVKSDVIKEEGQIKEKIELGNKYLSQQKYDDAKQMFEKAISIDQNNKDTYIKIKDCYLDKERLDDAYYIIKNAITNKVDVNNMQKILEELSNKFTPVNFSNTIAMGKSFNLPNTEDLNISDKTVSAEINWNNNNVDTSKAGTFIFKGTAKEYGRPVVLTLNVHQVVKDKKLGYVSKVYERNGKRYLTINDYKIYFDDEAVKEALKDNSSWVHYDEDLKTYYCDDNYYLKCISSKEVEYEISDNSSFLLCDNKVNPTVNINYNNLKSFVNNKDVKNYFSGCPLFWINTEDGVIVSIQQQYTP